MMAPRRTPRQKCGVKGCAHLQRRLKQKWCNAHLLRLERHGDLQVDKPIQPRNPRSPRSSSKVIAGHWLWTGQVAKLLGVNKTTVKRATDAGKIPHTRTSGGHRRYDPDEIYPLVGKGIPVDPDPDGYVARCRVCGCTDLEACFGGCTWVAAQTTAEGEICSRCVAVTSRKPAVVK